MVEIKYKVLLKEKFKDLLDKKIYEKIILKIMNDSKIVFPEKYKYIEEQSNNESDFLSSSNREIDAKILFAMIKTDLILY